MIDGTGSWTTPPGPTATVRRGICRLCGKTIAFLPVFSLPYSHYSLIARSEALRRFFVEGCSWEKAVPPVKDPQIYQLLSAPGNACGKWRPLESVVRQAGIKVRLASVSAC